MQGLGFIGSIGSRILGLGLRVYRVQAFLQPWGLLGGFSFCGFRLRVRGLIWA